MVKLKTEIEYPCGLKICSEVKSSFYESFNYDGKLDVPPCPIHGKNCKRSDKHDN